MSAPRDPLQRPDNARNRPGQPDDARQDRSRAPRQNNRQRDPQRPPQPPADYSDYPNPTRSHPPDQYRNPRSRAPQEPRGSRGSQGFQELSSDRSDPYDYETPPSRNPRSSSNSVRSYGQNSGEGNDYDERGGYGEPLSGPNGAPRRPHQPSSAPNTGGRRSRGGSTQRMAPSRDGQRGWDDEPTWRDGQRGWDDEPRGSQTERTQFYTEPIQPNQSSLPPQSGVRGSQFTPQDEDLIWGDWDDEKKSAKGMMRGFSKSSRWRAIVTSRPFLITALVLVLLVAASGLIAGITGYSAYTNAKASAEAGMTQLKSAQTLLDPYLKHPALPDTVTLTKLNSELSAAHSDFSAARGDLTHSALVLASPIPEVRSATALLTAADELTQAGLLLTKGLAPVITVAQGGFFASTTPSASTEPQMTPAMLNTLLSDYEAARVHINMAITDIRSADLSSLKQFVSSKQMAQIQSVLANWGTTQGKLDEVDTWLHLAPTLLGMTQPEKLLVEFMDRGEMRSTGGYVGAYSILSISKGKIQPFTLQDILTLDIPYLNSVGVSNSNVPSAYSWWPFPGFGLRDSNLSPDFPTSAKLGLQMLAKEGGPSVQGVVSINATVIADLLKLTGPVVVPLAAYNDVTVNASNFEQTIRIYTETSATVDPDLLPAGAQLTGKHENFTALLGQQLMNKIHSLHGSQSAKLLQIIMSSIPTKDTQVYFSDQQTEALINQMGAGDVMPTGPGDAVTINDSNVTGNKASAFTNITYTDNVTLDAQGDATHHLTIDYHFDSSSNPALVHFLYGKFFYHTYLRIYTPPNAKMQTSQADLSNEFNRGYLQLGHSDFPGRQMWGGLVDIVNGQDYVMNFVWTVPTVVTAGAHGQDTYSLLFQHQSGSNQRLVLTITKAGAKSPSVTYNGALDKDRTFTLTY